MLFATLLQAQAPPGGDGGLVYGEGCAFFVNAPKGWTLDNLAGKRDGLPVVFYPRGSSWKAAPVAMYAHSVPKSKGMTLASFLADDRAEFLKKDPRMAIVAAPSLKTSDGRTATVRRYDSTVGRQHDTVAFIDLPKAIVSLCLTSRTAEGSVANAKAFPALVFSFRYFTDKVDIDKGPRGAAPH